MVRVRQDRADDPYERVLQRVSQALERCEQVPDMLELEVSGLTRAELGLIQAWLRRDAQWLSGWHAALEEQAALERRAQRASWRGDLRLRRSARRALLSCALCGHAVPWPDSDALMACPSCGSHVLRARQSAHTRH